MQAFYRGLSWGKAWSKIRALNRNFKEYFFFSEKTEIKKLRENKHLKLNLKRVTLIPPKNKNYRNKSIMYKSLIYDNDI